jgi:hypothetical protein
MIIDSHCHLDYFSEAEIEDILARAAAAGVERMVTIGTSVAQAQAVKALVERFPQVWGTVGVHPHRAAASSAWGKAGSIIFMTNPRATCSGRAFAGIAAPRGKAAFRLPSMRARRMRILRPSWPRNGQGGRSHFSCTALAPHRNLLIKQ